ncbi:hypothetical protein GDO86_017628 [Hymenochirus boettgeri]|uniref:Taste receptor type 2 n=1 Tax=Hymenochirus boettgeri TaxID=247094 RepID=A0A8T2IKQ2_9PIPI|nr:hypothetical protein GDO86_017628 [Hymenochirus boettgeri]
MIQETVITILKSFCLVECSAGIIFAVFIMLVNFRCWMKGEILNPSDQIIIALAFSSAILSGSQGANVMLSTILHNMPIAPAVYTMSFFMSYATFSSSWLGACLCFFFFVKMNNLSIGFIARLKMIIDLLIFWLFLGIQVFSISTACVYTIRYSKTYMAYLGDLYQPNKTSDYNSPDPFIVGLQTFNCLTPFIIAAVSSGYIIVSLCQHTQYMKQNALDGGTKLRTLQRAARTMIFLLILYLVFYGLSLPMLFYPDPRNLYWVYFMVLCSFSFTQSIILIQGNNRLLHTCMKILNRDTNVP